MKSVAILKCSTAIILVMLSFCLPLYAQDKIQVAVKTIYKEINGDNIENIKIEAEKSQITIKGWNKSTIQVELKLFAKHPNKVIAVREVEYNRHAVLTENKTLILRNDFHTTDNYPAVKSNLSAQYIIFIPNKKYIEIINSYGKASIQNYAGDVTITAKFCPVHLEAIKGKVTTSLNYSDLTTNQFDGDLYANGEKSNYSINQISGSCSIKSRYGQVTLFLGAMSKVNINGNKTDVKIFVDRFNQYSYDLATNHADIQLPPGNEAGIQTSGGKASYKSNEKTKSLIFVTTSFSSIYINSK